MNQARSALTSRVAGQFGWNASPSRPPSPASLTGPLRSIQVLTLPGFDVLKTCTRPRRRGAGRIRRGAECQREGLVGLDEQIAAHGNANPLRPDAGRKGQAARRRDVVRSGGCTARGCGEVDGHVRRFGGGQRDHENQIGRPGIALIERSIRDAERRAAGPRRNRRRCHRIRSERRPKAPSRTRPSHGDRRSDIPCSTSSRILASFGAACRNVVNSVARV